MRWLIPRLFSFNAAHPNTEVRLSASDAPVDFEREHYDIAIRVTDHPLPDAELTHLFVEPGDMGTGVGRALLARALDEARAAGLASVLIESDPDAERFYLAAGAERIGERRAGTGRMLPLLRIVTGS
jgi:DNA-binding transcriptional LysR family regulator